MGRILVVEDHEETCRLMARLLRVYGHDAACALSGEQALAELSSAATGAGLPDVVLLDAMMPGMDGLEVLRRLRSDPLTADVPVVMCSAVGDAAFVQHALAKGANDYLVKTRFDAPELLRRLEPFISPSSPPGP